MKPDWIEALSNLGVLYMQDDELELALGCLQKATNLQVHRKNMDTVVTDTTRDMDTPRSETSTQGKALSASSKPNIWSSSTGGGLFLKDTSNTSSDNISVSNSYGLGLVRSSSRQVESGSVVPLRDAFWNLNCVMRRLGRKQESLDLTKRFIESQLSSPVAFNKVRVDKKLSTDTSKLSVVCVKWGSKYGPEYVIRLFRGVQRHLKRPFSFICFTDDSSALQAIPEIRCESLPEGWKGWWNKAALFGQMCEGMKGRVLYVDLDTVITGPLDELCACQARFAILSTKDIDNEGKDFSDGFNSSLLLWSAGDEEIRGAIHDQLREHFEVVHSFVHRFDHWLELTIEEPCIIQETFPSAVVDFKHSCMERVPEGASVVIFPLQPKPHECLDTPWIREHWLRGSASDYSNSKER